MTKVARGARRRARGEGQRRTDGAELAFVSDLRGILTNGLAAPVITDANYSGSAWASLKLIPPFKRRAKGASRLAADWPSGMTRKCSNMASYLISLYENREETQNVTVTSGSPFLQFIVVGNNIYIYIRRAI